MTRSIRNLPGDSVYSSIDSPVGKLIVVVREEELHAILWQSDMDNEKTKCLFSGLKHVDSNGYIDEVRRQLDEYFHGNRREFDLRIVFNGTAFQKSVWNELLSIPYGDKVSYEDQAVKVGGKEKVRAVGMANGANPISIVVPCHRVIGKNGSLTGFGGGLTAKRYLLSLEESLDEFTLEP